MIVDFHTHIFPPAIAPRTIEVLRAGAMRCSGIDIVPYTDATADGLRASMKRDGIDLSVVMPIATKPSQTESINRYAKEVSGDGLLSFGILCATIPRAFSSSWQRMALSASSCIPSFRIFLLTHPNRSAF